MLQTRPSIIGEFDAVELGDERLNARLLLLASSLARDPEQSFPDVFEDSAELEAGYRFFNNPRVEASEILRPHVMATAARLAAVDRVLAIHDTTEFVFGGKSPRHGLEDGDRFHAHICLAVSADSRHEPLGVLAIDPWVRGAKKGTRSTEKRRKEDDRESKRWLGQSIVVDDEVGTTTVVVHVEDREGDIYESMSTRLERGMHFIVRAQTKRVVVTGEDDDEQEEYTNILEHLRAQPRRVERDIVLSRRQNGRTQGPHQDREGRHARIAIAAAQVTIRRSRKDSRDVVKSITLNAVHVIEVDPPEGEQIVEWLLLTTEPAETVADIEFVVDSYRARWVIEEYFKALKTGCNYQARQLESYDALLRALSIFAVIAWRLLWTRTFARDAPSTPATFFASKSQLGVLCAQGRIGPNATVDEFLRAVAKLGGHLKRNGPPGWLVLWRGYRKLGDLAAGYAAAQSKM
jgi:hypothetical protein